MAVVHVLPSPKSDCSASAQSNFSGRTSRRRTPRASSQVQKFQMQFASDREHAHALQHVAAQVQSCQAVFSRQPRCTDGLEAPRLEIFVQGAALSATFPVSFVTDVSISARTSLVRRFSGRDWSGERLAALHAFRVVFGPPRATGADEQRLALPSQSHDPWWTSSNT